MVTFFYKVSNLQLQFSVNLTFLKGVDNIADEFKDLVKEYPDCINAIPLLLAVRDNVIAITDNDRRLDWHYKKVLYLKACKRLSKNERFWC